MMKGYIQKITNRDCKSKYYIAFLGNEESNKVSSKDGLFAGAFTQEDMLHCARVFHSRDKAKEYIMDKRHNYLFGGEFAPFEQMTDGLSPVWGNRPALIATA